MNNNNNNNNKIQDTVGQTVMSLFYLDKVSGSS